MINLPSEAGIGGSLVLASLLSNQSAVDEEKPHVFSVNVAEILVDVPFLYYSILYTWMVRGCRHSMSRHDDISQLTWGNVEPISPVHECCCRAEAQSI